MQTLFFKNFLIAGFRINAVALGITFIKEVTTDYLIAHDKLVHSHHNEPYKTAEKTFIEMGANLDNHPLQLRPLNNKLANVHANLITGEYCLGVFHHSYDRLNKRGFKLSHKEFNRAIFAHESVHAMERHDLCNTYISSLFALTTSYICICLGVRHQLMFTIAFLSTLSSSRYVSRQLELRADRLAAEKDPSIRENLIAIFSVPDHKKDYFFGLFSEHPTKSERREALVNSAADLNKRL